VSRVWRRRLKLATAFLVLMAALVVSPNLASAVEDASPPTLAGFSFEPTSVDVSSSSATVTVKAHVLDNLSGTRWVEVFFQSPTGSLIHETIGLASGTTTDGIFEGPVTIPQYAPQGEWHVYEVSLRDFAGNYVGLATSTLEEQGFPTVLNVRQSSGEIPAIKRLTPSKGPAAGGTAVTVAGAGFTGATSVTFGSVSATEITVNPLCQRPVRRRGSGNQ
jgi:hypothetical protein